MKNERRPARNAAAKYAASQITEAEAGRQQGLTLVQYATTFLCDLEVVYRDLNPREREVVRDIYVRRMILLAQEDRELDNWIEAA
jgi:hypothetical protein